MTLKAGQEIRLKIREIAPTGRGMGLHGEDSPAAHPLRVFVDDTAPGDEILALITKTEKGHAEARRLRLYKSSPMRSEPPCPHYEPCGGCALMHLKADAQKSTKEDFTRYVLREALGASDVIEPLDAPSAPLEYRNRVTMSLRIGGPERAFVFGYYARGSHALTPIARCLLAHPALSRVKDAFEAHMRPLAGAGASGEVRVTLAVSEPAPGLASAPVAVVVESGETKIPGEFMRRLRDFERKHRGELAGVAAVQEGEKIWSEPPRILLSYRLGEPRPMTLSHPAHSFSQVSWDGNRALAGRVLRDAQLKGGERVLDLYSGCGNFTLPLAASGARDVLGVESDGEAVEAARANAAANACGNARFERRLVHDALRRLGKAREKFDVAVLDPPRSGVGAPLRDLARLDPKRIVYVSCSLRSLARDLDILHKAGYVVRSVKPYDLFPQTAHVECVAALERVVSL